MNKSSAGDDSSVICSLSALQRKTWAAIREEILVQGGKAVESLGVMESAVLTLCLEDQDAPPDVGDVLNSVRLGGEGGGPCLRYYDKVLAHTQTHTQSYGVYINVMITFVFIYIYSTLSVVLFIILH